MRFLTRFSLRNPVAIAIVVLLIAVGGVLSALGLQEDLMPDLSLPVISVVTTYPGASPNQVATDITTPIEKALNGATDVQTVTSTSVANVSQVELQLKMNADLNTVVQQVDQIVNQVPLPTTAGKPTVQSYSFSNSPVLEFTVAANKLSQQKLKSLVNNTVVPTLQGMSGVATVSAFGAGADNVVITFDPAKLTKHHLTLSQVLQDLENDNATMPLGTATAQGTVQPVQLNAAPRSLADIRNLRIGIPVNPSAAMQKTLQRSMSQTGIVQAENNLLAQLQQIQGQVFGAELTLHERTSVPRSQQDPQEIAKLQTRIHALETTQKRLQQQLNLLTSKASKTSAASGSPVPSTDSASASATSTKTSTLQTIPLSEIATVSLQPPSGSSINRTNGQASILVTVSKRENANTVTVVKAINSKLSTLSHQFPAGVHVVPLFNASTMITASVNGMLREAVLGAIFAVIVILLFLRNWLTTIVSVVSIPISILTAMILLSRQGITLNIMTLGGLAVATGRVVDDSIVVIENIYRTWKHGFGFGKKLVLYATAEVGNAILSSTLATIAVFLPLAFVGGLVGKIFFPFALTVVCALASSLIVALTIVPTLAWLFVVRRPAKGATYDWMQGIESSGGSIHPNLVDGSLETIDGSDYVAATTSPRSWQKRYQSFLNGCLNHKGVVILGTAVVFVGSLSVLPFVGSTFIPNTQQQTATVSITMPIGTPLQVTNGKARQVETTLKQDASQIEQVDTSVGGGGGATSSSSSTNVASLYITLKSTTNVNQFLKHVRQQIAQLAPSGTTIQVQGQSTSGGGTKFDLVITGSNPSAMQRAATEITDHLRREPGLANVQNNVAQTQAEVRIVPNFSELAKEGVTAQQVASDIRYYVSQPNIGTMSVNGQMYNLDVTLTSATKLNTLSAIRNLPITTTTGTNAKLRDVATVSRVQTPSSVLHSDGRPYVEITADYTTQDTNKTLTNSMQAIQSLNLPSGIHVAQSTSTMQQSQSFTRLIEAILVAIGMVYMVMLVLFGGWAAPLAILFSMPVALIGALFATFITHQPLSVSSLIGILLLMGIVVTNAIVLIQRVEQQRRQGLTVRAALLEAGTIRLRPILMTAVATICALIPLALGASEGILISQGLAIVVIGGLVSSTVLTLCIVPVMYELLHLRTSRRERSLGTKSTR